MQAIFFPKDIIAPVSASSLRVGVLLNSPSSKAYTKTQKS
jgi:hypothetical protein